MFELYTDLEYLHTAGVQSGVLYQIRISAKNKHGWSEFSDILEVLAATEPSEPQVTSSIQEGPFTELQWSLPNEHGSTVVEYEIKVQAASLDLIVIELCNGSEYEIVESRSCKIAYADLRQEPFNLVLGDEIIFVVKARNTIGWGPHSISLQSKDVVRTEPLPPLTLVTEGIQTDDSKIHIEWQSVQDPETGLDEVIEYIVYWDNGSDGDQWVALVSEQVPDLTFQYVEKIGIVRAHKYLFQYISVNQHGLGQKSGISEIIATSRPSQILPVMTENSGNLLFIQWIRPDSHGDDLLSYTIEVKQADGRLSTTS